LVAVAVEVEVKLGVEVEVEVEDAEGVVEGRTDDIDNIGLAMCALTAAIS
jgi:hypothetical protein